MMQKMPLKYLTTYFWHHLHEASKQQHKHQKNMSANVFASP